jgi:hypothetical protein
MKVNPRCPTGAMAEQTQSENGNDFNAIAWRATRRRLRRAHCVRPAMPR